MRLIGLSLLLVACASAPEKQPDAPAQALDIPPIATAAPSIQVQTEPVTATAEPEDKAPRPTNLAVPDRDPRIMSRPPRSRTQVLSEAQALERQLAPMNASTPGRADMLRKAGDAYAELAYTSSGPDANNSRRNAIKHYVVFKAEHPNEPQWDEVCYYLGLAYELNGELKNARTVYYDLIKSRPQSQFIPHAYFSFGEMFYEETLQDPSKADLAMQAFAEVIKYPSPLKADALLRMGEVALRKGDQKKANEMFAKLKRDFPTSAAAQKIP